MENWKRPLIGDNYIHPGRLKVENFIEGDTCKGRKIRKLLPYTVDKVLKIQIEKNTNDCVVWTAYQIGNFSCKSSRKISVRRHKTQTLTAMKSWQPKLPFKVSFFTLRLLNDKLTTDDIVQIKGMGCMNLL